MKIVYCLDSINAVGGLQKITVTKANALADLSGNEVWVIVADNSGSRVLDISDKVRFVNLTINYYEDDWKSRLNVLKGIFIKRIIHRRRLALWLHRIIPDVVVAVGQSEKFFLPFIKGDWVTIREFHSTRDYRKRLAKDWYEKASAWMGDLADRVVLRKFDKIVVLTQEDKVCNWGKMARVAVIPNPSGICPADHAQLVEKRVIAVGRLSHEKNYASMIRAFAIVADRFPEWQLDVFGDGGERKNLEQLIDDLSLGGVINLRGSTRNVCDEMLHSSLLIHSSRFEGFGIVLVEAMSCGLPVVSFACPYGPKDIITDGVDGFLVPVGDERMMADRICKLIENDSLRRKMGDAALEKSRLYSLDQIIPMWMGLFGELVRQKK